MSFKGITTHLLVRTKLEARENEPDAIYPDVYIPTTFENHINGRDPVWDYLVENVFKN